MGAGHDDRLRTVGGHGPGPAGAHLPGRRAPLDEIAASADHVWAALAEVTIGELRLFRLLMGVRVLPGRLRGSPRARFAADEPLLGWAVRFGFTILGEEVRRELVVGAIGQPWRLTGGHGIAVAGGHDFAAFEQAGYAKMAANFRLAPSPAAGPSS